MDGKIFYSIPLESKPLPERIPMLYSRGREIGLKCAPHHCDRWLKNPLSAPGTDEGWETVGEVQDSIPLSLLLAHILLIRAFSYRS